MRVSAGTYDVDIYLPPHVKRNCFKALATDAGTIAIEGKSIHGGTFSAILNAQQHTLAFEALRFPEPLYVAASGPVGVVERSLPERAASVLSLNEPSVTLIYDTPFMKKVDPASVVEVLQRGLRNGEKNPAALLPALGSERIPFIAISLR
jgi:hypothetical protein